MSSRVKYSVFYFIQIVSIFIVSSTVFFLAFRVGFTARNLESEVNNFFSLTVRVCDRNAC